MPRLHAIPPWLRRFFLGAIAGGLIGILVAFFYPSRANVRHPGGATPQQDLPTTGAGGAGVRSAVYTGGFWDDLTLDDSEVIIGKIVVDQALAGDMEGAIETIEQETKISCKDCVRLAVVEALLRQPKPYYASTSTDATTRARTEAALKDWAQKAWSAALKMADTFQNSLNKADALRRIGKFQQQADPAAARETLRKSAELAASAPWVSPAHPVWDWIQSASLWVWTVVCGVVAIVLKPTLEEVVGKGIAAAVKKKADGHDALDRSSS
jgi:hypothetical protein